jgi:colanic acid/amylovoran biosynthesis glycosyltransferase
MRDRLRRRSRLTDSPRIGYITSAFARPSDTFIRNEVNQLRALGVDVVTFSIRRPEMGPDADDDVQRFQNETEYLLEARTAPILFRAMRQALSHPLQFLRTAVLAWRTSALGVRGRLLQAAYLAEALYLASRLRTRKIDFLHNHIGENSATVAMLASEFTGIPFSLTIHGPNIFYAPHRWALGAKIEHAAFTVCISDFCRSQCLVFAAESRWPRIHVVRCSVQAEFIDAPLAHDLPKVPHFLCVGRLCAEKGQILLAEAAAQLLKAGHEFCVSFIGEGPSRLSLEQRIRELNACDQIRILGWQSSARVRELLQESTALVIPSFAEGLPVVAMEALAMRRPVIATNIAAMSELVENEQAGWLVPAGSVDALAGALKLASECPPEKLQTMGERGRNRVVELHHPVQQADKLRTLFFDAQKSRGQTTKHP